ncbi:MAG: 3' terminal RNA ribose 2'-O-methyltransferase Hen1 [Spirochaetaceae bacterium]|nr:3' terminal RNA ribose 2'-O-methyltransferase Hen1 [Spirochaetaceae bacterium]
MLFTVTYTGKDPTDLGYLLHKNPARPQTAALSFGRAHVFYPETGPLCCTAALLLDIDPPDPFRNRDAKSKEISDFVNDRPYVCSSFMSTAISTVYGTAMSGRCAKKQELADSPLDLKAGLFMLPCWGGGKLPELLFGPLGYEVKSEVDGQFSEWGNNPYINLTIRGKVRLRDLLNHIYVLIPVFDQQKHYWIGEDEINKLLNHGKGWLEDHPEKRLIARCYFKNLWSLTRTALDRLEGTSAAGEKTSSGGAGTPPSDADEPAAMVRPRLNMLRLEAVIRVIKKSGARSVIELGCGDGKLLRLLLKEETLTRITGVDVSPAALKHARKKLKIDQLPETEQKRISLFQGSVTYRDKRFRGYDAALLVEVIEHLDENRLDTLAEVVFGDAHPGIVVISTPNIEYNKIYGRSCFRHRDHRFEWNREQFRFWAERIAGLYNYDVSFEDIGQVDAKYGAPTQMGVFVQRNFPSIYTITAPDETTQAEIEGSEFYNSKKDEIGQVYDPPKPLDYDTGSAGSGSAGPQDTGSAAGLLPERAGPNPTAPPPAGTPPAVDDVLKRLTIRTGLHHDMVIDEKNGGAALEIMSRFSADPRWLIYLPPAMSPCKTSSLPEFIEHPQEAFAYYRKTGLTQVVCEEKHLGSRAVIVLCRSPKTTLDRFGVEDGSPGIIYTRIGRHFFDPSEAATEYAILERLGNVLTRSGFWEQFATDWVCLDTELFPGPAKARGLFLEQYAPVGKAGKGGIAAGIAALQQALSARLPAEESSGPPEGAGAYRAAGDRSATPALDVPPESPKKQRGGPPAGMNVAAALERFEQREECLDRYITTCRRYCRTVSPVEDYRIAPFHLLATEGKVWNDKNHLWHLETIRRFMTGTDPLFISTSHTAVDPADKKAVAAATDWWLSLTGSGGEGMIVKPVDFIARRGTELLQPAIKCRGREYLRIIYGPEYTLPEGLERLRNRSLAKKRRLALAEFALGMESLERFVRKEPFHRFHECVFALLALENETVDPRL